MKTDWNRQLCKERRGKGQSGWYSWRKVLRSGGKISERRGACKGMIKSLHFFFVIRDYSRSEERLSRTLKMMIFPAACKIGDRWMNEIEG